MLKPSSAVHNLLEQTDELAVLGYGDGRSRKRNTIASCEA